MAKVKKKKDLNREDIEAYRHGKKNGKNAFPYGVNKFLLLTGAGFTKDFGGFLAKEMWVLIFNQPELDRYPNVKSLIKNDFDYESIYYKVIESDEFKDEDKGALRDAIFSGYKKLDDKIRNYRHLGTNQPVSINDASKFIDRFSGYHVNTGRNDTKGFFFTLNQDLLIERYFSGSNMPALYVNQPTTEIYHDKEYEESTCSRILPLQKDLEKTNGLSSSKYFYVKLHGSMNWYSSDGNKKLVIGKNKLKKISDEPVLEKYFELFKKTLSNQDIKLFVIGYGFGDEHINGVIKDSIKNNNLNLYVLNPSDPESFKNNLKDKPYGELIWNGLAGYYPYSLSQVFSGAETVEYKLILDSYFNS